MSIGAIIFSALILAVIAMGGIIYLLNQARKKYKADAARLLQEAIRLRMALDVRDTYIKKLGEIESAKTERLEKISAGTDADRFDGSLGVLSDIAKNNR